MLEGKYVTFDTEDTPKARAILSYMDYVIEQNKEELWKEVNQKYMELLTEGITTIGNKEIHLG